MLTIYADVKTAARALDVVREDQAPYATALALTRTAQVAQKNLRDDLPERFRDRGGLPWLSKGIRIEAAKKDKLTAFVVDIDWFMLYQEEGGMKGSADQLQRVPGEQLSGLQLKPKLSEILLRPGEFIATNQAGEEFVAHRVGEASYPIVVDFFLRDRVRVQPRFHMADTVERTVRDRFPGEFATAMRRAIATAK